MTHESIEQLIDLMNQPHHNLQRDRIFVASVSDTVDFAYVWNEEPRGNIANEGPYPFYFIKGPRDTYVAAVLDMDSDLHAVAKAVERGRGYVSRALEEVILPKFWQEGRKVQRVTFEDLEKGRRFAAKLGFTLIADSEAQKDLSVYEGRPRIGLQPRAFNVRDVEIMRRHIGRAKLYLMMVKQQLEIAYGPADRLCLDELIYGDVGNLDDEILNFVDAKHREFNWSSLYRMG